MSEIKKQELQDLSKYSKEIEDRLIKALSEELSSEINKDILRKLGIEPDRNKRRKNSINNIFRQ